MLALLILPAPFAPFVPPSHMLFRAPTEILSAMTLPRDDALLCRAATSSSSPPPPSLFFNKLPPINAAIIPNNIKPLREYSAPLTRLSCLVA